MLELWKSYQQTLRVVGYLFLSFFLGHFFVIWFLHFFVIPVLWCHVLPCFRHFFCHLLSNFVAIFLSFCCRFLVVFYFLALFIFLSFSHKDQASGEGGKPGLGNAKKCKKWLPVWEMQNSAQKMTPSLGNANKNAKKMTPSLGNAKKMQKNAKKMQKQMQKKRKENAKNMHKMTRVLVKLRFWSFQVGPASRAWAAPPPRAISPRPRPPPPGFWAGPAPRAGRQLLVQAGPKTNSPGQAPLPYPSSPPAGYPRVFALVPCIWCCHEVTKGLSW